MGINNDIERIANDLAGGFQVVEGQVHWPLTDEEFFCAGGCHVLAKVFLDAFPDAGFRAFLIKPVGHHRLGLHVFVASKNQAFDCRGYTGRQEFFARHVAEMRESHPDWEGEEWPIDENDLLGEAFCKANGLRLPTDFPGDVLDRARSYLAKRGPPPPQ